MYFSRSLLKALFHFSLARPQQSITLSEERWDRHFAHVYRKHMRRSSQNCEWAGNPFVIKWLRHAADPKPGGPYFTASAARSIEEGADHPDFTESPLWRPYLAPGSVAINF